MLLMMSVLIDINCQRLTYFYNTIKYLIKFSTQFRRLAGYMLEHSKKNYCRCFHSWQPDPAVSQSIINIYGMLNRYVCGDYLNFNRCSDQP